MDFPRLRALGAILLAASTCLAAPPETLQFAVEWRLIPAGTAKLSWTPSPTRPPVPAPQTTGANGTGASVTAANIIGANMGPGEIQLHLESSGLVSRLFRVNDDYRSVLDPNLCAESSLMLAREGNRNKETRVTFDARAGKALWAEKDLVKSATTSREVEIPSCVHDVMGGLMALRGLRLEPGKTVRLPISDGKKSIQARIEAQEREDVRTPLGTFRTVRYEVFLFNDVLFRKSGHLHVWLTDDDRRLPVQLQVRLQITIGTITFRLIKEESQ
ncbi:MAG TPA: DUF3108 domain-containing protein [Bryobacteraceae bacterium]|nr:DUF3108 domain-containing protein [Bryobacteraceae bacterium]